MNTKNLKTFSGYVVSTDLTERYCIFEEEFGHCYGIMFRMTEDPDISEILVASAVLNFPIEPAEEDDTVEAVTPVDDLFRVWIFHHVTAERFGKIVVAAKLGILSTKDAQAVDAEMLGLDPYPDDPSYTVAAETKDGSQEIIGRRLHLKKTNKE